MPVAWSQYHFYFIFFWYKTSALFLGGKVLEKAYRMWIRLSQVFAIKSYNCLVHWD